MLNFLLFSGFWNLVTLQENINNRIKLWKPNLKYAEPWNILFWKGILSSRYFYFLRSKITICVYSLTMFHVFDPDGLSRNLARQFALWIFNLQINMVAEKRLMLGCFYENFGANFKNNDKLTGNEVLCPQFY